MSITQLPPPAEAMQTLLNGTTQFLASDIHLKVNYAPFFRVGGLLHKAAFPVIEQNEYMEAMLKSIIPAHKLHDYEQNGSIDFSYKGSLGDRFRCNVFRSMGEMHAAIRRVQNKIPTYADLNLPPIYEKLISETREGLICVTGVTGSGKSSTLAAMIDHLNNIEAMHVITVEDPIEYSFTPKKCIISQREIGLDVPNFPTAMRSVVREDPDIIFIGEMRDRDTLTAALQAAETGHLVFGTLHVGDVVQSFNRILEFFPRNEHSFIRSSMSNGLRAILCQRLIPGIEAGKVYPASEVLINSPVVKDKVRNEEDEDLPAIIAQSEHEGMRSFTHSLVELIEMERIHYDTAMEYAPSREALQSSMKGIKASAQSLVGRIRSPRG